MFDRCLIKNNNLINKNLLIPILIKNNNKYLEGYLYYLIENNNNKIYYNIYLIVNNNDFNNNEINLLNNYFKNLLNNSLCFTKFNCKYKNNIDYNKHKLNINTIYKYDILLTYYLYLSLQNLKNINK